MLAHPIRQAMANKASSGRPRLLIAEDDDDIRLGLAELFVDDGFEVVCLENGTRLVDHLQRCIERRQLPDIIVMDHRMPGHCGLEILEGLVYLDQPPPVIVITAFGNVVTAAARALGARAVFDKPFDPDDLRTAVVYWLGAKRRGLHLPSRGGRQRP